jgi:hypothetical protein
MFWTLEEPVNKATIHWEKGLVLQSGASEGLAALIQLANLLSVKNWVNYWRLDNVEVHSNVGP